MASVCGCHLSVAGEGCSGCNPCSPGLWSLGLGVHAIAGRIGHEDGGEVLASSPDLLREFRGVPTETPTQNSSPLGSDSNLGWGETWLGGGDGSGGLPPIPWTGEGGRKVAIERLPGQVRIRWVERAYQGIGLGRGPGFI